jgi:hypothetical protein
MMKLQKRKEKQSHKKPPNSTKQTRNLGDDTRKTSLNARCNKL